MGDAVAREAVRKRYHEHWGYVARTAAKECDVRRKSEVDAWVGAWANGASLNKNLDVIYCAGVNSPEAIGRLNEHDVMDHFHVNVIGFINVVDALVRHGVGNNITVICSDASRVAMRNSIAYCSSKAALVHAVRCAARELAPYRRVNGINPGIIDGTPMTEELDKLIPEMRGWTLEEARAYEKSMIPMGRRAQPSEVAELTVQATIGPQYMTGSIIDITGGK